MAAVVVARTMTVSVGGSGRHSRCRSGWEAKWSAFRDGLDRADNSCRNFAMATEVRWGVRP